MYDDKHDCLLAKTSPNVTFPSSIFIFHLAMRLHVAFLLKRLHVGHFGVECLCLLTSDVALTTVWAPFKLFILRFADVKSSLWTSCFIFFFFSHQWSDYHTNVLSDIFCSDNAHFSFH
jgi:hypothetical protein